MLLCFFAAVLWELRMVNVVEIMPHEMMEIIIYYAITHYNKHRSGLLSHTPWEASMMHWTLIQPFQRGDRLYKSESDVYRPSLYVGIWRLQKSDSGV